MWTGSTCISGIRVVESRWNRVPAAVYWLAADRRYDERRPDLIDRHHTGCHGAGCRGDAGGCHGSGVVDRRIGGRRPAVKSVLASRPTRNWRCPDPLPCWRWAYYQRHRSGSTYLELRWTAFRSDSSMTLWMLCVNDVTRVNMALEQCVLKQSERNCCQRLLLPCCVRCPPCDCWTPSRTPATSITQPKWRNQKRPKLSNLRPTRMVPPPGEHSEVSLRRISYDNKISDDTESTKESGSPPKV